MYIWLYVWSAVLSCHVLIDKLCYFYNIYSHNISNMCYWFCLLQLGFMLLALIWKFDFPPFMVLIIAILNDGSFKIPLVNLLIVEGSFISLFWLFMETHQHYWCLGTIMTISKDRVKPSPLPDSWKLAEIFTTGIVLGSYLAMMTVIFFWASYKTNFFPVR